MTIETGPATTASGAPILRLARGEWTGMLLAMVFQPGDGFLVGVLTEALTISKGKRFTDLRLAARDFESRAFVNAAREIVPYDPPAPAEPKQDEPGYAAQPTEGIKITTRVEGLHKVGNTTWTNDPPNDPDFPPTVGFIKPDYSRAPRQDGGELAPDVGTPADKPPFFVIWVKAPRWALLEMLLAVEPFRWSWQDNKLRLQALDVIKEAIGGRVE